MMNMTNNFFFVPADDEHDKQIFFVPAHDEHDKRCQEYERELAAIREDLVDSINAW